MQVRRGAVLAVLAVALAIGCTSCGDVRLMGYRDDSLIKSYKYTLGEQYIEIKGIKYCYQEFGAGEAVLILPGLGTNIDFWQETIPVLAEQYHVVAVDPPGFGKSDKPDASYELSWTVDRVVDFMDAKGLRRVNIIGGSMGGHLGMLLALKHPERVSKLVLMGSVGDWAPPTGLMDFALTNMWNEALCVNVMRERWPDIYAPMFKYPRPLTERIFRYQMALRANGRAYDDEGRAFSRSFHSIFYSSVRDRLEEIYCPVLLVWGEEDTTHPSAAGEYFNAHLRDSELVIVKNAAHEVMVDQPVVFNRLMLRFFKEGTQHTQAASESSLSH